MLLEEEFSEISTRDGPIKNQSNIVLSESFVQLETSVLTKGLVCYFTSIVSWFESPSVAFQFEQ